MTVYEQSQCDAVVLIAQKAFGTIDRIQYPHSPTAGANTICTTVTTAGGNATKCAGVCGNSELQIPLHNGHNRSPLLVSIGLDPPGCD